MQYIRIQHIFISPGHGFVGRDPENADRHQMTSVASVECHAGKGLKGDRYFDYKQDFKGQVTFFEEQALHGAFDHAGATGRPLWSMRRNVMVSGIDLNSLVGHEFEIDGIRFFGTEECAPCRWMDRAIGEGAREYLKNRGGLRARILSDGVLTRGEAQLEILTAA